jgi:hypothetical protein
VSLGCSAWLQLAVAELNGSLSLMITPSFKKPRVWFSKAHPGASRLGWGRRKPVTRGRFVAEVCSGRSEKST